LNSREAKVSRRWTWGSNPVGPNRPDIGQIAPLFEVPTVRRCRQPRKRPFKSRIAWLSGVWCKSATRWAEKVEVPAEVAFDLPPIRLAPTMLIKGKLLDQQDRPVAQAGINGLRGNRRYGFGRTNESGEFSLQIPKALPLEGYEVWLEDDDSPHAPKIEQHDPLILRL
jgi:hypothetical protein